MTVVLIALLVGSTVLMLMLAVGSFLNTDASIGDRLETFVSASGSVVELPAHSSDQDETNGLAKRLNHTISEISLTASLRRDLARANIPLTAPEYILLKIATTLVPVAIVLLLTRSLFAVPGVALVGFFAPTFWVRARQRRRSQLFEEQLPETLSTIISSLRSGFSLVQAMGNVAREAPEPTMTEMRRVVQEMQFGLSLNDALINLAKRTESADLELLVSVLQIHTRVGGNLTTVLENISTTIKERSRLRREIRVITSQQRYASYVLGLLPVILAGILMTINPNYMMKLFQPGLTLVIPAFAVIMNVLGFTVIQKIVDIKV